MYSSKKDKKLKKKKRSLKSQYAIAAWAVKHAMPKNVLIRFPNGEEVKRHFCLSCEL